MKHVHGSATDEDPNASQLDRADAGSIDGEQVQPNGI